MRLSVIIASLGGGGAERVVLSLCAGLREMGYRPELFCLDNDYIMSSDEDIETHTLSKAKSQSVLQKSLRFFTQVIALLKISKKQKFGYYISHMERSNIVLLFCATIFPSIIPPKKCILTVHNHLESSIKLKTLFKKLAAKVLYFSAARYKYRVVFVSECSRNNACDVFGFNQHDTSVIPNFVPVKKIHSKSQETIPEEWEHLFAQPVILGVGRLSYQKGFEHLLRAFSKVKECEEQAQLIILGEGELKNDLLELAKELNIINDLHFPGFVSNPFSWLRKADVYVMSSLYEGMPMILLEALSSSAAIVSTDCFSGPREVLAPHTSPTQVAQEIENHSAAVLVPPIKNRQRLECTDLNQEESLLAEAILPFLQKPLYNLSCRQAAFNLAQNYDISSGAQAWDNLIKNDN